MPSQQYSLSIFDYYRSDTRLCAVKIGRACIEIPMSSPLFSLWSGIVQMVPSVWAITGIKLETFDRKGKDKLLPDAVTGRLHKATNTIMQGGTWVDEAHSIGYAYLKVSLQKMEDFDSLPLAERGLGAVSGGYILSSNDTWSEPVKTEQKWGVVDSSKAIFVCGFYSKGKRYSRVMVCFDRANAAPVSGFWRNGKVLVGPNIQCDQTDWGRDLHSGSHAIALEKGKFWLVVWLPLLLLGFAQTSFYLVCEYTTDLALLGTCASRVNAFAGSRRSAMA